LLDTTFKKNGYPAKCPVKGLLLLDNRQEEKMEVRRIIVSSWLGFVVVMSVYIAI
jgi:hypothetical protein